jgi:hypothetical protein
MMMVSASIKEVQKRKCTNKYGRNHNDGLQEGWEREVWRQNQLWLEMVKSNEVVGKPLLCMEKMFAIQDVVDFQSPSMFLLETEF